MRTFLNFIVLVLKIFAEFVCWVLHVVDPTTGCDYRFKFFNFDQPSPPIEQPLEPPVTTNQPNGNYLPMDVE